MPLIKPAEDQLVAVEKFRGVTGAFLGDSMGTGKTVTAIARDWQLRIDHPEEWNGPTLIVTEKIGLDVWSFHLEAMGNPKENIIVLDPANRATFELALGNLREDLFRKRTPEYFFYVMHYHAIALITDSLLATPHPIEWFHVIADEFQLIKNPKALRTRYLKRVKARYKSGLSGNGLADDKPQDAWSLLNWLYPRDKRFSSFGRWGERYLEFEDKVRHDWFTDKSGQRRFKETGYREITGVKNIEKLHEEIEPFYIRRLLTDIIKDMPEKIYVQPPITVDLSLRQRRQYEAMARKSMARIGDIDDGGFVLMAPAVVAVVQRLQQMALGTLTPIWEAEEGDDPDWDHPRIAIERPSPKLDALMELITNHEEEPFIVFSWFRGMVDLVEDECKHRGISVVKIHGGITSGRAQLVEKFQCGEARVFVGTIASAGKVITLDRSHHVIFTDRSWNPNTNRQAEDRAWRRMQRNAVRIYSIEARDTIDQVRREKIRTKADLVDAISNPARYA